jgi:hypothetical protein
MMLMMVMAISERGVVYAVEWKIFEGEPEGISFCCLLSFFFISGVDWR